MLHNLEVLVYVIVATVATVAAEVGSIATAITINERINADFRVDENQINFICTIMDCFDCSPKLISAFL